MSTDGQYSEQPTPNPDCAAATAIDRSDVDVAPVVTFRSLVLATPAEVTTLFTGHSDTALLSLVKKRDDSAVLRESTAWRSRDLGDQTTFIQVTEMLSARWIPAFVQLLSDEWNIETSAPWTIAQWHTQSREVPLAPPSMRDVAIAPGNIGPVAVDFVLACSRPITEHGIPSNEETSWKFDFGFRSPSRLGIPQPPVELVVEIGLDASHVLTFPHPEAMTETLRRTVAAEAVRQGLIADSVTTAPPEVSPFGYNVNSLVLATQNSGASKRTGGGLYL